MTRLLHPIKRIVSATVNITFLFFSFPSRADTITTLHVRKMIALSVGLTLAALPVAFAATFTVQVGAGGNLAYDPEFVLADPGDTINFVL